MRWEGGEKSENIEDRRSSRGPGLALGGGSLLVIMLVGYFLGVDPEMLSQLVGGAQGGGNIAVNGPAEERELTPEEKRSQDFSATILRFTEVVWGEQFQRAGERYEPPKMVLFAEQVQTGCGVAPSAVGPFYCPRDKTVYLDPTFFDQLAGELGGSKADFSQAYVIAHEVGHHVQNLLGYSEIVDQKRRTLPKAAFNEWSVRLELQADYLAGVWAHYGQEKFRFIDPGDIESAIQSANAIGDDRLQRRSSGFTSPENYTHGTSAQRVKWFKQGYQTGDLSRMKEIFTMPYDEL